MCTDASSKELVKENTQDVSKEIMESLDFWYPAEQFEGIQTSLARVVKASIDLSRLLRQQRAYWSVTYRHGANVDHSDSFDTEAMTEVDADDIEEESGPAEDGKHNITPVQPKRARFNVFPGLFKQGNADGLHYEIKQCYAKIRVKSF